MIELNRKTVFASALFILLFAACGDDGGNDAEGNANASANAGGNGGNGGSTAAGLTISGTVDDFDGDAMNIEITRGLNDLGAGQIEEDGSFSFELYPLSETLEDPSEVLSDASTIGAFMSCDITEENFSDTDFQWRTVNSYLYTGVEVYPVYQEEDDWMWVEFGVLRLVNYFDDEDDRLNFPHQNVFWIYVDRDVSIDAEECGNGSILGRSADTLLSHDLDLQAGWNEVVVTYIGDPFDADEDDKFLHETTDRPASVEWQITEDIH